MYGARYFDLAVIRRKSSANYRVRFEYGGMQGRGLKCAYGSMQIFLSHL